MRAYVCIIALVTAFAFPACAQDAAPSATRLLARSKITLTKAAVEAGRLVVEGKTAAANTNVKLNGLYTVKSNAQKAFAFSLVYLPADCIAELATASGSDQAVVAMCAKGLDFRSTWLASATYALNDLVTLDGSTWRAKRASKNKRPTPNPGNPDWEVFAAKGTDGAVAGGLAGYRVVKKVCDDTAGWVRMAELVYCVAQCPAGEVALSSGNVVYVSRETNTPSGSVVQATLGMPESPLPQGVWYAAQLDTAIGTIPPKGESFSRMALSLTCGAP